MAVLLGFIENFMVNFFCKSLTPSVILVEPCLILLFAEHTSDVNKGAINIQKTETDVINPAVYADTELHHLLMPSLVPG